MRAVVNTERSLKRNFVGPVMQVLITQFKRLHRNKDKYGEEMKFISKYKGFSWPLKFGQNGCNGQPK